MSYALKSCYFTTSNGRKYTIVATKTGKTDLCIDAVDTIMNQEGKKKSMTRIRTIALINS